LLAELFGESGINTSPVNLSMTMSLDGENVFESAPTVSPYFVSEFGAEQIYNVQPGEQKRAAMMALLNAQYAHPMKREYATRLRRTLEVSAELAFRLTADRDGDGYADDAYQPIWTAFNLPWQRADAGRAGLPQLGQKLLTIARVIRQRGPLQMLRQLFYVQLGGFDTHDAQNTDMPRLLGELSKGIKGFYDVIDGLGLSDRVTTFTASDFGRTLTNNGDGTDHAWGSHHFVVGGSVKGGKIYGRMPHLGPTGNPDAVGFGQIVPTLACDQYAATLASWFGVGNDGSRRDLPEPPVHDRREDGDRGAGPRVPRSGGMTSVAAAAPASAPRARARERRACPLRWSSTLALLCAVVVARRPRGASPSGRRSAASASSR
jgi:hypothetical protein